MEALLDKCLSSLILESAEKRQLLDVIVVNDGSKDKSSEIAHKYAGNYPEVFSVIDKENGNYGSCINAALPHVKGKYVRILDADDSYDSTNLIEFINILENITVDMVLSNFVVVDQTGIELSCKKYSIASNKITDYTVIPNNERLSMHSVTYRSSIFNEIDYHQTEGVSYTDMEWIFHPLSCVNSVFYFDKTIYKYFIGREGQTVDSLTMIKRIGHLVKGLWTEIDVLKGIPTNNKAYERLEKTVLHRLNFIYVHGLSKYALINLKDFDNELKKKSPDFYDKIGDMNVRIGFGNNRLYLVKLIRKSPNMFIMNFHPKYLLYRLMSHF